MKKLLLVLMVSLFAQSIYAEDEFTFNVPVSIERVDFSSATVTCTIYRIYSSPFSTGTSLIAMGENSNGFTLRNPPSESVSKTVTVKVSATATPDSAKKYKCEVSITLMNGETISGDGDTEQFIERYESASGKDIESARIEESDFIY